MNVLAFAGLLRLLCAVSEPSQPPPPTPLPTAVNEEQESNYADGTSSPTEQPIISPADKHDCVNEQRHDRHKESSNDLMIWFTEILAFAAIVQFVVMGIQGWFMHLTRCSYEKGERAALWTEEFDFPDVFIDETPDLTATYNLVNTGNTSADIFAQQWSVRDDFPDDKDLPDEPPYEGGDSPNHFTIPAGKHFFRTMKFKRSDLKNLGEVRANKRWLYLFGYIRYRDAFKKRHTLRIAVKYMPKSDNIVALTDRPNYNVET